MTAPPLGITARATVNRVVDGDTIDVSLLLPVRIRLRDCWAPELHGAERIAGEDAKMFVEHTLGRFDQVIVSVPTSEAQSLGDVLTFGRLLGDVYVDGESLAELVVGAGLASREKPQ